MSTDSSYIYDEDIFDLLIADVRPSDLEKLLEKDAKTLRELQNNELDFGELSQIPVHFNFR